MKRKINIDRPHLSTQEIASRQDFSSLMKQLPKVTKPPFYKTGWFITTVASVAGIAVITTNFILNDNTSTLNPEQTTSTLTDSPPGENTINVENNPHELTAPVILASNNENSTLTVHEVSSDNSSQSEMNSPDIITQQLQKYEDDMLAAKAALEEASSERIEFEKKAPVKPLGESNPSRQFVLDIDPKEFPELSFYKNLLFEVDPADLSFSPSVYDEEWEDIQLKSKEKGKTYYLSLYKDNLTKTFTVFPVYAGSDFEIAMNKYEKEFEIYSLELKKRKALEEELKANYEKTKMKFDQLSNSDNNLSKTN